MSNTLPFANRTAWPLASNKISVDLKNLQSNGISILDLTESNPTRCRFSYLKDEIFQVLAEDKNLSYVPSSRGDLKAREAIGAYYREKGHTISPDQIFLTASTSEAYSYLFRLLANPDDQILFPRPSYPLFTFLGHLNDVRMDTYSLIYDKQWRMSIDSMKDVTCDKLKAIVLVNPNNPTGSFVQNKDIKELNKMCAARNISIICDEVFTDFSFDQNKNKESLVCNEEVLTFTLGGISKTLGLPQMKLSWIVVNGPKDFVETACARLEVIADTYLSVNTPAQNAFPVWLSNRQTIQDEIRTRICQNYAFLHKQVKVLPECELLEAEGGWYAVLRIPTVCTEEEWMLTFLNKDHVYAHPGYFFDFDHEAFAIISLLPEKSVFQEGIKRILKRISRHLYP